MSKFTLRLFKSIVWGSAMSILITTILTVTGELRAPLKNWLAATFTHHWLGKSIVSVIVFAAVTIIVIIFSSSNDIEQADKDETVARLLNKLLIIAVFAAAFLIAFYLYEYFK